MKRASLSLKLFVGGILVVLIPLVVVVFISVRFASTALEETGRSRAKALAGTIAEIAQTTLGAEQKSIQSLALNQLVVQSALLCSTQGREKASQVTAQTTTWLTNLAQKVGQDYESLIVVDKKGDVVADSVGGKSTKINIKDREYYIKAWSGSPFISKVLKSRLSGNAIVAVAVPIKSGEGATVGVMAGILKTGDLAAKVIATKIGQTGYPWMIDHTGVVVAHPNTKLILTTNASKIPGMEEVSREMMAGKKGTIEYMFKGVPKTSGFAPVPIAGWSVGFTQDTEEFMATATTIRDTTSLVSILALVLTGLVVFFFARTISKPINQVASQLDEGSDQVASASHEVAQAGSSLAQGTSQQAASIEEMSASLEELTSMTKANADNASQADTLMKEVSHLASSASRSMDEMKQSMDDISTSGQEIGKIIKSIDEIAFQTNLLALNAAVEAARAGEAGAGFAVVADEVRNLALRAAEAAKNTAQLIEGTTEKITHGTQLVARVDQDFAQVTDNAGKVGELVSEIAAASHEQTQGISQINSAVREMDKVTQTTAANAEETAASAEELSAQAQELKGVARGLRAVLGGRVKARTPGKSAPAPSARSRRPTLPAPPRQEAGDF